MSDEARSAIPAMPAVLGLAGCLPDLGAWNADREGQGRHGAGAARASTGRHVENRVGCSLQASACRGVTAGPSSPPPSVARSGINCTSLGGYTPLSVNSMPSTCYVLARKFPKSTTSAVYRTFTNCSTALDLVLGDQCVGSGGMWTHIV